MLHDPHLSDDELIQALDGELAPPRAAAANQHVVRCWRCRTRSSEIERAIAGFVRLERATLDPLIPPADGAAARLRAHLAELSAHSPAGPRRDWTSYATLFAVAASVLIVAGIVWMAGVGNGAGPLPDARLTPGATRSISRDQVCVSPAPDGQTNVPKDVAYRVFKEYGIRHPQPQAYEVDYLISPALGGADDIRNLWPQPYKGGVWNARVKDALEDYLRTEVCRGSIDLVAAQQAMASDWIAAYRKYFRTARPLPAHALFVKDRPWE